MATLSLSPEALAKPLVSEGTPGTEARPTTPLRIVGPPSVADAGGFSRASPIKRSRQSLWAAVALLVCFCTSAWAQTYSDEWASPRNRERDRRRETRYIILHTTEAPSPSALRKLSRNGEAHYLVDERGQVFRIVDRRRIAYHCGRSLWNGRTQLDLVSVGIEVAGYHNRDLRPAQIRALSGLVKELQRLYRVPDDRVLPHSMVAYGAPNRWHPRNHRGRKRCGMQFADDTLRRQLGLHSRPRYDPDVRAGRLVNADPYLARTLFSPGAPAAREPGAGPNTIAARRTAWDIARERYNHAETRYVFPDGSEKRGNDISNWRALPAGTRVVMGGEPDWENEEAMPRILGRDGDTPNALAGEEWNRPCTVYLLENRRLVTGASLSDAEARALPSGTRVWIGYTVGEPVTARRRVFDICGPRWNAPDTFYLFPDGTLTTGDRVEERRIPEGTRVLFRGRASTS